MPDLRRALTGLVRGKRNEPILLRKVPMIAELEALLEKPGASWAPTFEPRCNEVSLALFGITQGDTNPKEPHPDDIEDKSSSIFPFYMNDVAFSGYAASLQRWDDWQVVIDEYERDIGERGPKSYFARIGYDVTDGYGVELQCLPFFSRQLY